MAEYRTKRAILKVEDDEERTVTARFATLGVVDRDEDIIEPGAIGEQQVLLGAWNHDFQGLPPGMGRTYEANENRKKVAMFEGKFLDTPSGKAHYDTLKAAYEAGFNIEWSFRFFVEDGGWETRKGEEYFVIRKAQVSHVAPVEVAAGVNTGTVEVKCDNCDARTVKTGLDILKTPEFAKAVRAVMAQFAGTTPNTTSNTPIITATNTPEASQEPEGKAEDCACHQEKGADETAKDQPDQPQDKGQILGDLLRQLRDAKDLTNEDLADASGVAVSTIGGILAGTHDPSISVLERLARRLGAKLSSLVAALEQDSGQDSEETEQEEAEADPDDEKAAEAQEPEAKEAQEAEAESQEESVTTEKTVGDEADEYVRRMQAICNGVDNPGDTVDPDLDAYHKFMELATASEQKEE